MSKLVVAGGTTLALSTAVLASLAPTAALATTACAGGGTLISAGVCEIQFTSGTHTFTPPAGITKLDALVVGAGGVGWTSQGWWPTAYGGGGGDVKVVAMNAQGAVSVVVGAPENFMSPKSSANDSSINQGSTTTTASGGGHAGSYGPSGSSGNGNAGTDGACAANYCLSGGAGAGASATANATTRKNGGSGIIVKDLVSAASTLFSADTDCFGGGGGASGFGQQNSDRGYTNGNATCGGGHVEASANGDGSFHTYVETQARANSGGGGGVFAFSDNIVPANDIGVQQDGAAGYVALRYDGAVLPNTGTDSALIAGVAGLGIAGIITGAGAIYVGRRKRS